MTAIGDYLSIMTDGWWRLAAATPTKPTLSVVDDGTATSATATVDGDSGATNQLYYRSSGSAAWTTGLSRTGDGDIQQTGLSVGYYEFICVSTVGGVPSLPSNPAFVTIAATSAVTPADSLSLPLYYLRKTVAASASFQAWVSAGSAAEAENHIHVAELTFPVLRPTVTDGAIASVAVVTGGKYYASAPTLTAHSGTGTGASLTAVVAGGAITSVTVVDGGEDYEQGTTEVVAADPYPCAVIDIEDWGRSAMGGGTRTFFGQSGSTALTVLFQGAIGSSYTGDGAAGDAAFEFLNRIGPIIEEMELLAGTGGYLDIEGIEKIAGPARPTADQAEAGIGHVYMVQFRVTYREL